MSTLLIGLAPAAFAGDTMSEAGRAAEVIERATGTQDLATGSQSGTGSAAQAVIDAPGGGSVTVTAPKQSTGRVEATSPDGATLGLGLPATNTVLGLKSEAGTVVYPDAAPAIDIAVQPTTDGASRTLVTLKSSAASTEQRFELDLPARTEAIDNGDGGYGLIRQPVGDEPTVVVGTIDAPWAKDAAGKEVPTKYKLDGRTLVQSIETNDDTAFPVVADPKVSFGWATYIKFSKAEVKKHASKMKYAASGAALCGFLSITGIGVACAAIAGGALAHLQGVWASAKTYNKCVELKFSYLGQYYGAKNYKC
ncbi:hypothetical protein ACIBKX_40615 [Streptomyces sp. NPDC050658]|uniref:hypothetical protein n=1 Tax=unclassified Streptomyces TaxID=2593676 RepID=UPI00342B107B